MTEWLGLPPLAATHGGQIDSLIGWMHVFMLILFVGWGAFFVYALIRFRRSRNPVANYAGVKSHTSSYLEVGVLVVEMVLLFGFSIPLWAMRVDRIPSESETLVVHVTGDDRGIRVRDPGGPLARGFRGFTWFPIDERYRVLGRLVPDPAPQQFRVLNTYGHVDEYTSEGVVEFELLGQTLRLRPFTTRPKRFYFVFRDASSGEETYETARFLYSDLRDDGTTLLDFNMAYNPPCAFNPYTTCPIPLRENRLPVKILAGEKAYEGKSPSPAAR